MTVVVPKLLEIFEDKSNLPATTKSLIFVSDVFRNYWYLIIIIVIIVYFIISFWKKTPS